MTAAPARVRRCRECGSLLTAGRVCRCDIATVHVITDLGPTDLPGLVVPATLLGHSRGPRWHNHYDPSSERR